MARYRVTAELVYFTEQPDMGDVYAHSEDVQEAAFTAAGADNVQLTVSTILELPEEN